MNIIHHPDGDYKQLAIRENTFIKILDNTIWYKTDTAPGSSGSPVYNDQWQVVALHHMGIPKMTDDRLNYADKDGNPIPLVDGKVDAAKVVWEANEGIRISKVLEDIFKAFPNNELVLGLKKPSEPGALPKDTSISVAPPADKQPALIEDKTMENISPDDVRISFPASLLETNGNININISNRARGDGFSPVKQPTATGSIDGLDEAKKIDIENAVDYSDCEGYIDNFLGTNFVISMPKPKAEMLKFVAKLKTVNSSILNYYFFSTIHHSVRKMPMISL